MSAKSSVSTVVFICKNKCFKGNRPCQKCVNERRYGQRWNKYWNWWSFHVKAEEIAHAWVSLCSFYRRTYSFLPVIDMKIVANCTCCYQSLFSRPQKRLRCTKTIFIYYRISNKVHSRRERKKVLPRRSISMRFENSKITTNALASASPPSGPNPWCGINISCSVNLESRYETGMMPRRKMKFLINIYVVNSTINSHDKICTRCHRPLLNVLFWIMHRLK